MKKKIIPILIVIIMMINQVMVIATGVTSYPGKSMTLENGENIDIIYNEVLIDVETSNISNTYILQNTSNSDVVIKASIPLENLIVGNKIENLEIKINNAKVKYEIEETEEEVIYKFNIKAKANEVKKVEIKYKTQNDLNEATIIKYNMEGMKIGEKRVKKVKVDVKIRERDIPMVTNIYPPHYTFDLDTKLITVEYYNMPINNLTKNIIIEKIAYESLTIDRELSENSRIENKFLYGEYYISDRKVLSGYTKIEFYNRINNYIAQNVEDLLIKDVTVKELLKDSKIIDKYKNEYGEFFYLENDEYPLGLFYNITQYKEIREYIKNKKYGDFEKMERMRRNTMTEGIELLDYLIDEYLESEDKYLYDELDKEQNKKLYGKIICIDTAYRSTYNNELESNSPNNKKMVPKSKKIPEDIYFLVYDYDDIQGHQSNAKKINIYNALSLDITDTIGFYSDGGARLIYLDRITDENISNKERIEYVNSIGADLYVRYDITEGEKNKYFGYNNEIGYKFIENILNMNYSGDQYIWLDGEKIENPEYNIYNYIKKVDDDTGLNYSKVPAIIMYKGYIRLNEEGLKVYYSFER